MVGGRHEGNASPTRTDAPGLLLLRSRRAGGEAVGKVGRVGRRSRHWVQAPRSHGQTGGQTKGCPGGRKRAESRQSLIYFMSL